MDWLKGMNSVVAHIEENLTTPIMYESLSRIVGCSVYEFSRIFSFMAGVSVSEYVRRRRLSQAIFDIQRGSDKIIDIAFKYCWESPTTFTRAFKELHKTTPLSACKTGVPLKTYPPITFILSIKGAEDMEFRKDVPAATWAVFPTKGVISETFDGVYARILTEWFPASNYKRDNSVPHLEVFPGGTQDENYVWEIWMPIVSK